VSEHRRIRVIRVRAQLQRRGPAAAIVLNDAQVAAVGEGAKRFPVVATANGDTRGKPAWPAWEESFWPA
jgi:hypothetical protein